MILPNYIWTLVRLEARVLLQNRMACVVIVLILIAAVMLRFQKTNTDANLTTSSKEVCYVMYWQQDDWVRRLQVAAQAEKRNGGLSIEVIPAAELTDTDGVIRYPPQAHSIQLRPIQPTDETTDEADVKMKGETPGILTVDGREGWLIWYWYSGSDAAAILPYAQWFQHVTHEHFNGKLQWHERASPLEPQLTVFGRQTRVAINSLLKPDQLGIGLIWLTVFFVACHLSKLSIAQNLAQKNVHTLAVTPAGWNGPAIANGLFYGLLAFVLATTVAVILSASAIMTLRFWITISCATLVYLGVGLTIASCSKSVASASVGTIVYFAFSGLAYAIASALPSSTATLVAPLVSADATILTSMSKFGFDTPFDGTIVLAMIAWSCVWLVIGALSYRQLRRN